MREERVLRRKQSRLTLNAGYGSRNSYIVTRVTIAREIYIIYCTTKTSSSNDQAVHGYQLEHVVLAWCENDSDAR